MHHRIHATSRTLTVMLTIMKGITQETPTKRISFTQMSCHRNSLFVVQARSLNPILLFPVILTMSSSKPQGLSLADRFRRTLATSQDTVDYESMTLETMGNLVIPFGDAKRGQTFRHVVMTDPKYVTWFTGKYGSVDPPNPNHVGFLTYVRKYVEKSEENANHAQSKAKAKAKIQTGKSADNSASEEEMDEPSWDLMDKQTSHESRLDRLEYSLGLLLQQASDMTQALARNQSLQQQ